MGGSDRSGAAYVYAPDRKGRAARSPTLQDFKGLAGRRLWQLMLRARRTWRYAPRLLVPCPAASTKSLSAGPVLIASEALKRIAGPYAIKSDAIGALPRSGLLSARKELGDHCGPSSS
jgi:hypothetical protein